MGSDILLLLVQIHYRSAPHADAPACFAWCFAKVAKNRGVSAEAPSPKYFRPIWFRWVDRTRWQFAQTTSHFSISTRTSERRRMPMPEWFKCICFTVPGRWSKSMAHDGNVPPQSAHGCDLKCAIIALTRAWTRSLARRLYPGSWYWARARVLQHSLHADRRLQEPTGKQ